MVSAAWRHARWLVIALLLSIALNLLLGAMVGGHHMRGWFRDHGGASSEWLQDDEARPIRYVLWRLTRELDEDERAQFRDAIAAEREPLIAAGRALLDQRRAVIALLRMPAIDRAAVDAALAELDARQGAFHQLLMSTIADAAATLPPEARARLGGWD